MVRSHSRCGYKVVYSDRRYYIATGTAIALAAAATTAAAGAGVYSANKSAKTQEKSVKDQIQAQKDLAEPQKELQSAFLPYYRKGLDSLYPDIERRMTSTELPQDILTQIGKYEDTAGRRMGESLASRGMMGSGVALDQYRQLQEGITEQKTGSMLGEQRAARSEMLSLLGMNPGQASGGSIPMHMPSSGQQLDYAGMGRLISQFGSTPTAAVADPTGSYNVGYGQGFYPGGYSGMSGL